MKVQKRFLLFFVFILYFSFLLFADSQNLVLLWDHFPQAHAESLSLSVSPSLLRIEAVPPAEAKASLTLENQGDKSVNIHVLFKAFRPSDKENGEIAYLNDQETPDSYKKIFNKIHLTDNGIVTNQFELGPKQKKNLELQFAIPKNEPGSDYYFSVIFLTRNSPAKPDDTATASQSSTLEEEVSSSLDDANPPAADQNLSIINAGIAINVLLSIGAKDNPQGAIQEFNAPSFLETGPVGFTVRVKNTGSHMINPKAIIFIKNMFGQTVGRIDTASSNILAGTTRYLTDTQTASASSSFSLQKIYWRENFLLGPYTATLNLALSDKGPIYNRSVIFLALPIQFIIGIILALLIITIILLRVKYHLKTEK